jgi:peptide/nickel transport system permease protein
MVYLIRKSGINSVKYKPGLRTFFKRLKLLAFPGIPLAILAFIILLALFAPFITHINPNQGNLYDQFIPPAWMKGGTSAHLLGTDYFGRDTLTRLIYGARVSLSVAFIVTIIGGAIGTLLGLISGYKGGLIDIIIMRVVDGWLSFPIILIAILLAVMVGPSYFNVILILSLLMWPTYARQIRGEALVATQQEYVAMSRVAGSSGLKIIWKHLLPNVVPTLIVIATFGMADVILTEAMLSFLGAGVPPPTASWGSMASQGRDYISSYWWLTAFPGAAIFVTVLSINLVGDWIRDRLDPRLRQL